VQTNMIRRRSVAPETAIASLLKHGSVNAASNELGITRRTLSKWLRDPEFAESYRAARNECLEHGLAMLQARTKHAGALLIDMAVHGKSESARLGAICKILDVNLKSYELLDLESRIQALEFAQEGGR